MEKQNEELVKMILPQGILEYFSISQVIIYENEIHISLNELNIIPKEYSNDKLVSKGFFDEITVQDFPIRGKAVYLLIKRRRWLNESTNKSVYRDWNEVAKGTRMTNEFATFLKGISRYQTSKL